MSKAKKKTQEPVRRLKFNGKDGQPYIVAIPARDLEEHELIRLAEEWDMSIDAFIEMLCSDTPGRRVTAGVPLYSVAKPHVCPECEQDFDVWEDFHTHALTHVNQEEQNHG